MIEILMLALSRIMWNGTLAKGLVKEDDIVNFGGIMADIAQN